MLTIGQTAPAFTLSGVFQDSIRTYSLGEFRGRWVVLFFYPADFTFICPTEIKGFSERARLFHDEGAQILSVSVDSVASHQAWARELGGIAYPLLSDVERIVCRSYDVLHPVENVAIRATFLVDPEAVIQYSAACSMNVGRGVEETLRVLKALRTGRLCPADWKPGDPSYDDKGQY